MPGKVPKITPCWGDEDDDVYAMDDEDEEDIFWEDEVEAILAG